MLFSNKTHYLEEVNKLRKEMKKLVDKNKLSNDKNILLDKALSF
jgi:hypothetical protein